MIKGNKKNIIKGFLVFGFYFATLLTNFNVLILKIFRINVNELSDFFKYSYSIAYQLFICIIIGLIFKDTIKINFIEYKNNFKKYLPKCLSYWFIMYILMFLSNLIITPFHSSINTNEAQVRSIIEIAPIYSFISAVFVAPILEEFLFRLSVRKIIPNHNWLFILVSGVLFGSMHVLTHEITVWTELLFLLPYSISGIVFAYALVKHENIFIPITIHMIHNTLLMILQLIY